MKTMIEHEFITEICCNCGCVFAMPKEMQTRFKANKQTFYCFNGHGQSYTKSTAEILQEKLTYSERDLADKQRYIINLENRITDLTKPKRKAKRVNED